MTMALLGHTARIIISVTSMSASVAAWQAAGFSIESEIDGFTRLTDGQVLVTLMSQEFDSPALAYFHVDVAQLMQTIVGKGLATREESATGFVMEGPGGVDIHVHQRSADKAVQPTGEQNPLLGYFDALVIGVDEPLRARTAAEELGFFVQEEFFGDFLQSDVTDGVLNLSFRQQKGKPFLVYVSDLDDEHLNELKESFGDNISIRLDENGEPFLVALTMPEGTKIMITTEDVGEEE